MSGSGVEFDAMVRELAEGLWRSAGEPGTNDLQFWLMAEAMTREVITQDAFGDPCVRNR